MAGIECPQCGSRSSRVLETRSVYSETEFRKIRMRECRLCKAKYPTEEVTRSDLKFPHQDRRRLKEYGPAFATPTPYPRPARDLQG